MAGLPRLDISVFCEAIHATCDDSGLLIIVFFQTAIRTLILSPLKMVINKIDNNNKNNKKNVEIIGFLCSSFQLINNQYFGSKRMAY